MHCFLGKFTQLEKFYTAAGRDKFQVCLEQWSDLPYIVQIVYNFCETVTQNKRKSLDTEKYRDEMSHSGLNTTFLITW